MSFLNMAFLWGLPFLAVPIAIHLLSRRRQEVVRWGAMQFLMESSIRRRKIWRVDDLILMALRTLAVLALVLALARPLWHGSNLGGGAGRDVIVVWDVSMSMGRVVGEKKGFDLLVEKTEDLFKSLGPTDSLRGLVTVGRGEWLTSDPGAATPERKNQLLSALKKTGVTESSADWFACLGTALRVSSPVGTRARLIVALSDGQVEGWRKDDRSGWTGLNRTVEEAKLPTAMEFVDVIGVTKPPNNLAVDRLTTPRQLLGLGEPFLVEAEVHNHGYNSVPQATVEWSLDGVSLGKGTVGPLGVGQSSKVSIKQTAAKVGISRISCRLILEDELHQDNERSLILETIDHVPALLVDDSTETDPLQTDKGYVLAALGQDKDGKPKPAGESLFRVTTVTTRELEAETLSKYRGIIFPNTPELNEAAIGKLTEFVRQGGGLWLSLGDRTDPIQFNRQFYRLGGGLAPWPIEAAKGELIRKETFLTIHPPFKEHPATILLSDTQRLDIDRVKVFQRFPFTVMAGRGAVPVLLQSGTGEPLAVEGFLGRGRVVVQSLPMGVRWSNLPLTQAYVPLIHEWLWYLIQPTAVALNLQPGETLQVPLPIDEQIQQVRLKRPGGDFLNLPSYRQGDQSVAQSRQTQRPGNYEAIVQIEGKPDEVRPYQVARRIEESNLDQWPAELKAKWSDLGAIRVNPSSPMTMPVGSTGQRTGEPLWGTLLTAVIVLLLCELWLAGRIASKRFGFRKDGVQPAGWLNLSSLLGAKGNR
ncbi:MAG: BatA domain-containing protein [Planctomycetales bacterium]